MRRRGLIVLAVLLCIFAALIITQCAARNQPPPHVTAGPASMPTLIPEQAATPMPAETPSPEPTPPPDPWTQEEVDAIARTLAGECYENKPHCKRLVAEVILNRVSDGRFGNTVIAVVTAKSQFYGYWRQSREISDNDREIATEALRDWYANDCEALSEHLFFEAGPNHENVFRKNF